MSSKNSKRNLTEKDIAVLIITSKDRAEDFIAKWMKRHKTSRENAMKKLVELGIELTRLPEN